MLKLSLGVIEFLLSQLQFVPEVRDPGTKVADLGVRLSNPLLEPLNAAVNILELDLEGLALALGLE